MFNTLISAHKLETLLLEKDLTLVKDDLPFTSKEQNFKHFPSLILIINNILIHVG